MKMLSISEVYLDHEVLDVDVVLGEQLCLLHNPAHSHGPYVVCIQQEVEGVTVGWKRGKNYDTLLDAQAGFDVRKGVK